MSKYDFFFFFKQKTAYEMRISDWSSGRVLFRSPGSIIRFPSSPRAPNRSPGTALLFPQIRARLSFDRSEERRVGKECVVRVDLGGRRIIKKKKSTDTASLYQWYNGNVAVKDRVSHR